jgi:hypothetical protein
MPVVDKYRDMGTMVMGKSEQGLVQVGDIVQVRRPVGASGLGKWHGVSNLQLLLSSSWHSDSGFMRRSQMG